MRNAREVRREIREAVEEARSIRNAAVEADRDMTDDERSRYNDLAAKVGDEDNPGPLLIELADFEQQESMDRAFLALGDDEAAEDTTPQAGQFASFGEQLQAIALAGLPSNVSINGVRGGTIDPRLMNAAASGGSSGDPASGGYLVQNQFVNQIDRAAMEGSPILSRCTVTEIGPNFHGLTIAKIDEKSRVTGSRWGGVRAFWAAEADTVAASRPKIKPHEISLEDLMGVAYLTERVLEDATALDSVYREAFIDEFRFVKEDGVIRGGGAGEMLGLLNSPALVTVAKEGSQTNGTVVYENVSNMHSRLHAASRGRAVWLTNQDAEPQMRLMFIPAGDAGLPVWVPPTGAEAMPWARLLGNPVIPIEQCDTVGQLGDLLFVDLSKYRIIKKGGIRADSSMHVRFLYNERTFRFVERVNGQPMWDSPLTPYKGSNTISPYVTLAKRAP